LEDIMNNVFDSKNQNNADNQNQISMWSSNKPMGFIKPRGSVDLMEFSSHELRFAKTASSPEGKVAYVAVFALIEDAWTQIGSAFPNAKAGGTVAHLLKAKKSGSLTFSWGSTPIIADE